MTTIFDDLANALAPYVGGTIPAGLILSVAVIFVIWVCMELILSTTRKGAGNQADILFGSFIVGSGICTVIGWLPLFFAFFVFVGIAWVWFDPMGSKRGGGNPAQ